MTINKEIETSDQLTKEEMKQASLAANRILSDVITFSKLTHLQTECLLSGKPFGKEEEIMLMELEDKMFDYGNLPIKINQYDSSGKFKNSSGVTLLQYRESTTYELDIPDERKFINAAKKLGIIK